MPVSVRARPVCASDPVFASDMERCHLTFCVVVSCFAFALCACVYAYVYVSADLLFQWRYRPGEGCCAAILHAACISYVFVCEIDVVAIVGLAGVSDVWPLVRGLAWCRAVRESSARHRCRALWGGRCVERRVCRYGNEDERWAQQGPLLILNLYLLNM